MIVEACENLLDWVADRFAVVIVGIFLIIVAGFAFLIDAFIRDSQAPTIALRKTEWACTGTRREAVTTYVQIGKVLTPITTYYDVCVEYSKR